ncbi:helix-turn-helix domain-containing protein [Nakamurella sp. A5-74]|uniref:Helix-turn-helix domain-containing protein n=1 Tax=Nakamurella sp. A5-74 TaxID=3158264 RepID=A0AAU8DJM3_9ACTN
MSSHPFLSLPDAALQLGCNPKTIRRYIASGRLTGYRVGPRLLRVDPLELQKLLRPIPTAGGGQGAS